MKSKILKWNASIILKDIYGLQLLKRWVKLGIYSFISRVLSMTRNLITTLLDKASKSLNTFTFHLLCSIHQWARITITRWSHLHHFNNKCLIQWLPTSTSIFQFQANTLSLKSLTSLISQCNLFLAKIKSQHHIYPMYAHPRRSYFRQIYIRQTIRLCLYLRYLSNILISMKVLISHKLMRNHC